MNNNVIKHGFTTIIQVWSYKEKCLLDCFVNTQDLDRANEITGAWYANPAKAPEGKYYVVAKHKGKTILLHRWITNTTDKAIEIDHIDNDGLNNRRINLRSCNHRANHRYRKPQVNWTQRDAKQIVATEYRIERSIASEVQSRFELTRQAMYNCRIGRTKSEAASEYDRLCAEQGVRTLFYLKQAAPIQKKFGVQRKDGKLV